MLPKSLWSIVRCPQCGGTLRQSSHNLICNDCGTEYSYSEHQLDLRLQQIKPVMIPVEVGRSRPRPSLQPIPMNPSLKSARPLPQTGNLESGNALTPALYSWFPRLSAQDMMLDLGCGTRRLEEACAVTGATYIGCDVDGPEPHVLCRGEALPFADESFDFVVAIAVIPHTEHPTLAVQEVSRILRPGSLFIGTAQFLEPCYMASRHHVTAHGLIDWLDDGGLEIVELEPNLDWDMPKTMLGMSYLPIRPWLGDLFLKFARWKHHQVWDNPNSRPKRWGNYAGIPYGEGPPEAFTGGFRFIARKKERSTPG